MTPIRDQPLYLALFSSSAKVEPYRLTISSTEQLAHYATGQMTLPYTFDRNLAAVMPALWYCLHLPRSRFDFVPLGARPLKESQRLYLPHRLALVPVSLDPDLMSALNVDSPQVILLQDDLLEEAGDLISRLTGVARVILTSEMTQQQLQLHWDALHKIWEPSKATPIRVSRLITDPHLKACLLPAQFIVRNLQGGSDAHVPAEFSSQDETLRYALHCQAVMSLTARLENAGTTPEDAERMFPAKLVEEKTRFTCPITVAMWGLPAQSVTRQMKKSLTRAGIRFRASDAEVENCALRFVVAHRALSQGGIGFIADSIPDEAFNLLACLEATWAASTSVGQRPKPRVVWRILHQIGALMAASFTKAEEDAIRHATSVTAFCEFPFSLAVMADGSDPLGFSIPIHYRPLVPLTNTLQFELAPVGSTYLKTHMKVLVAECISADQLVGKLSRAGWSIAARSLREAPNVQLEFGEFEQPQALRDALAQGQYDAVFISAHGHFDRQSGRTGIICGGTFVVEEELGDLPPIVCLSACQVSPRGTGSTNLGDLFLRRGAWVVIGPTVPVDVRHNAILMARFFTNVAETMQGRTDLRTLEQVWHFTTATNALNDVISTSPKVNSWALSRDPSRSTVIEEFMLRASVGRLRKGTIYADTQAVLSEMARARGFEAQFLASIRSQGYLPESAMYLTIGWPDLIVLHDPGFDSIAVKVSPVG